MKKVFGVWSLGIFTFSFLANVNTTPQLATFGLGAIGLIVGAIVVFLVPTAMASAELGAAFPRTGGIRAADFRRSPGIRGDLDRVGQLRGGVARDHGHDHAAGCLRRRPVAAEQFRVPDPSGHRGHLVGRVPRAPRVATGQGHELVRGRLRRRGATRDRGRAGDQLAVHRTPDRDVNAAGSARPHSARRRCGVLVGSVADVHGHRDFSRPLGRYPPPDPHHPAGQRRRRRPVPAVVRPADSRAGRCTAQLEDQHRHRRAAGNWDDARQHQRRLVGARVRLDARAGAGRGAGADPRRAVARPDGRRTRHRAVTANVCKDRTGQECRRR